MEPMKGGSSAVSQSTGTPTVSTAPSQPVTTSPAKYDPKNPNADLDLSKFDHDKLTGDRFTEYIAMVNGLNGFQNRDFVQYLATGIFEMKFDAQLNKVEVLVGIKINKQPAINGSRMPVNAARDLNKQIMDKNNPATNSRYWLLKKPE